MEKTHVHLFWKHLCRLREIAVELVFKTSLLIRFYIGFCYKNLYTDGTCKFRAPLLLSEGILLRVAVSAVVVVSWRRPFDSVKPERFFV